MITRDNKKKRPVIDEPRKKYQRFRDKKYFCDHCNQGFTLKQNILSHMLMYHHGGMNRMRSHRRRFLCTKCNKVLFLFSNDCISVELGEHLD